MKTVLKANVPSDVISCINEMVLDFSSFLSISNPSNETRKIIKERIDNLNKVINTQEWKINHFGVVVEYFYESKTTNSALAKKNSLIEQILKECDLVLSFCEQHFDITYFSDGTFTMSQKIGKAG